MLEVRRGDLFWVDFGATMGSEQGGKRPALVVQNDMGNHYSFTTIVIPLTSKTTKKRIPTHGLVKASNTTSAMYKK